MKKKARIMEKTIFKKQRTFRSSTTLGGCSHQCNCLVSGAQVLSYWPAGLPKSAFFFKTFPFGNLWWLLLMSHHSMKGIPTTFLRHLLWGWPDWHRAQQGVRNFWPRIPIAFSTRLYTGNLEKDFPGSRSYSARTAYVFGLQEKMWGLWIETKHHYFFLTVKAIFLKRILLQASSPIPLLTPKKQNQNKIPTHIDAYFLLPPLIERKLSEA